MSGMCATQRTTLMGKLRGLESMRPENGRDGELKTFLEIAYNEGKIEADAHYQALYRCFLDGVPPELRRMGEFAPSQTRPYGFNASSTAYRFGLNLGVDYAQAWAIFRFKTRPPHWELVYYDIWLSV